MKNKSQLTTPPRDSLNFFRNQRLEITGDLHLSNENTDLPDNENTSNFTITLRNPVYWNPTLQQILPLSPNNPDKFTVTSESRELAFSEFYNRLNRYISIIFPHLQSKPILTIRNTINE